MKRFDFETLPNRAGTAACKWERRTPAEKQDGIIAMSIADMEFYCPDFIREAVMRAAQHGLYGYTDPYEEYLGTVAGWYRRRHNIHVKEEDIICLYGVVPALHAAVRAFTRPGDGVIVLNPGYYPFYNAVRNNGRKLVECELINRDGRYSIDFDKLDSLAARPENKLILFCSPHNPVGRVWTREELACLSEICSRHDITVFSDEIHFDIILQGQHTPLLNVPGMEERTLLATSCSKTFNIPGLQLANVISCSDRLRDAFRRQTKIDGVDNISYFGSAAAIAAYRQPDGDMWVEALREKLRRNAKVFAEFFRERLPEVVLSPLEGTYLQWADFRCARMTADQLADFMRNKARLILDEGAIFGPCGEGFERFNLAMPEWAMMQALERLDKAWRKR